MTSYFTSDHFKLLNRWKGQKRDESNPEQNRAYEDLKEAYEITEAWANALKNEMFPLGRVEIRKRPTDQNDVFTSYTWAKIFPSSEAPKALAYTVGIDASAGFSVEIDVVVADPALKARFEVIRGAANDQSPIVALLPAAEGLSKSLTELVIWSVNAVRTFKLRYDEVVSRLNLAQPLGDEEILRHFDGKRAFLDSRSAWSPQERALFCRLARAVHAAGLDWWHMGKGTQVRFGRKHPGSERAAGVLGIVRGIRGRRVSWKGQIGSLPKLMREPLTEDLVARIETTLKSERKHLDAWLPLNVERPGLWPDQLRDDPPELVEDDETDDEDLSSHETRSVAPPVNRIYYGPPGTGKTYQLSRLLKREYEQAIAAVSGNEWRDQLIGEHITVLTWWEVTAAALYDLKESAKVGDLYEHEYIQAVAKTKRRSRHLRQTLWGTLNNHTVQDSRTVNTKLRLAPAIFDKTKESVWQFAGDWRESCADVLALVDRINAGPQADGSILQRYAFCTFHQSFGYEEFVEGLRPMLDAEEEAGELRYAIRSGVFKELCQRARLVPDQRFAMVIDEINRGNISKIFGELITLIEPDKRDGAENAVSVTLPYSGESFSVPANVDIIGTMNTADRSLALLDTALRRRFEFVPVMPDVRDDPGAPLAALRVRSGEQVIDVPRMLDAINQRVEALYDRDHCIGHAYFTSLAKVPDGDERLVALQQIFSTRILPLLEEYFFEDWQKIRLVLADNQKPPSAQFVRESPDHEDDLARLFGSDHGLESYATKRRCAVQATAFSNPDAYIGIYQTLSA